MRLAIPLGIQNMGSLKLLKTAITKNAVDAVRTFPVKEYVKNVARITNPGVSQKQNPKPA